MSQNELVLQDLKDSSGITPLEALERHGCFRLAAVIYDLKKEGWDISTRMVHNRLSRKKYARYSLNSDDRVMKKEYITDKIYQF